MAKWPTAAIARRAIVTPGVHNPIEPMSDTMHPNRVEIFDVTIRDGSYTIDFQFTEDDIRFLCATLERLGFRYIEVGHGFGLNAAGVKGSSAGTDRQYLEAAATTLKQSRFGTFFIPGIGRKQDLKSARQDFGMHFVRIGQDAGAIESAIEYIEYAKELGYEVMANFMKSYSIAPRDLAAKAKLLRGHGCDVVYLVDSAGGMLPGEVAEYVRAVAEACDVRIGFHGHNNLELASANAIAAYQNGCTLLDCSIGGLGRSSGNTRTEMLIPALRRMGVRLDYDLDGVFHVLDSLIAAIVRRKGCSSKHIAGGYALVHSGMMKPFEDLAEKHGIGVESLLLAHGDARQEAQSDQPLEALALELASAPAAWRSDGGAGPNALLKIDKEQADPSLIHCSFMAVEKLLAALHALARKATLPIALLVRIEPVAAEESFVMAEYLYHDDQFIVARALFGSVDELKRFLDAHHRELDVVVFEDASDHAKRQLAPSAAKWKEHAAVVHVSRLLTNYHCLFSVLYGLTNEARAARVLLFGVNPGDFARHLPPELAGKDYYCAFHERETPTSLRFFRLDAPTAHVLRDTAGEEDRFEMAILFSHVSSRELEIILDHMCEGGLVLNCVGPAAVDAGLVRRKHKRQVLVDLRKAITGELLNLLRIETDAAADGPGEVHPERQPRAA